MKVIQQSGQRIRPKPEGPDSIICEIREKKTGKPITSASGKIAGKYTAKAIARLAALRRLKKKLKRRYDLTEYDLIYR